MPSSILPSPLDKRISAIGEAFLAHHELNEATGEAHHNLGVATSAPKPNDTDADLPPLVGTWEDCDNPSIVVISSSVGLLASFDDDNCSFVKHDNCSFEKLSAEKGSLTYSNWRTVEITEDVIKWKQTEGDLDWVDGSVSRKEELRDLTWSRRKPPPRDVVWCVGSCC